MTFLILTIVIVAIVVSVQHDNPLNNHHLLNRGESYFGHGKTALKAAGFLLVASVGLVVHSIVPSKCATVGSRYLAKAKETLNI